MAKPSMDQPGAKPGKTATIELVKFRGEYFPLQERDYRTLKEFGVMTFRINQTSLDVLQRTLLKGKRVNIQQWNAVYPLLCQEFSNSLPEEVDTDLQGKRIIARFRTSSSIDERFNQSFKVFSHYMGRYGVRVRLDTKEVGRYTLCRVQCESDDTINPAGYFGSPDQLRSPSESYLYLSQSCRLRLSKASWADGTPIIQVDFQDRSGEVFSTSFSRSFPLKLMTPQSVAESAYFFADIFEEVTRMATAHPRTRLPRSNSD